MAVKCKTSITPRSLALCALFAALSAVGAFIQVPLPLLPFTLQTFFVLLAGLLLGARDGFLSQLAYLLTGLVGFPVFTQGGGIGYLLKPSFGYLLGFVFAAYAAGKCTEKLERHTFFHLFWVCLLGLGISYLFGCVYMYLILRFYLGQPLSLLQTIWTGAIVFLPKDLLVVALTAFIAARIIPVLKKTGLFCPAVSLREERTV